MEIWSNWWRQKFKKMLQFFLYQVWDTTYNNGKYFNKYEEVNIKDTDLGDFELDNENDSENTEKEIKIK